MRIETAGATPTTNLYATVIAQPVVDTESTVIAESSVNAQPTIAAESWWSTLTSLRPRHIDAKTKLTRG
ncbi:MAG TPA: hypothetical protein DCM54_12375 [Gammaproteobacteria bacterium]|nr:hypothetical protein [Gammaproteobacteria bacterium]|tara:strand:+ start:1133 stop:1339 length:207 start_codon:yes stop_codon:yes gene_type:complete